MCDSAGSSQEYNSNRAAERLIYMPDKLDLGVELKIIEAAHEPEASHFSEKWALAIVFAKVGLHELRKCSEQFRQRQRENVIRDGDIVPFPATHPEHHDAGGHAPFALHVDVRTKGRLFGFAARDECGSGLVVAYLFSGGYGGAQLPGILRIRCTDLFNDARVPGAVVQPSV